MGLELVSLKTKDRLRQINNFQTNSYPLMRFPKKQESVMASSYVNLTPGRVIWEEKTNLS